MICNYNDECPYENDCEDCMHRSGAYRSKTGLITKNMSEYKREYERKRRQRQIIHEMIHAGVEVHHEI